MHDLPILDPAFYQPVLFGVAGVVAHFLLKWKNPGDDTITGAFGQAFKDHSLSTALGFVAYLVACVSAHNSGALNSLSAFLLGYTGQSLTTSAQAYVEAKKEGVTKP